MKVLVTGGSGYLGTHVRNYFNADDLSRRCGLDLLNPEAASRIRDYDLVIHMAALVDKRLEAAEEVFRVNVEGTLNLLRHLQKGQTFIFCSTKDVYGHNIDAHELVSEQCSTNYCGQDAYSWSKLIAEHYISYYGARAAARIAIFRLSTVYAPSSAGNRGGFVSFFTKAINEGKQLELKMMGRQVRDLLYVDDLSEAIRLFYESERKTGLYNIGGGPSNSTTLLELTNIIGRALGKPPLVRLTEARVNEQINYISDVSRLERELGWRPSVSIEEGIGRLCR